MGETEGAECNFGNRLVRRAWQLYAVALLTAAPNGALAFSTGSAATDGCHEEITATSWKLARQTFPEQARALPSSGDDEALIADVPFRVPRSLRDIGGTTLLLGVRDNDIKVYGPTALKELAPAASDPKTQHEHCLRAPADDEPRGSADAVERCRRYIRDRLMSALDGLDESGRPDAGKRQKLTVSLAIRGQVDVPVPQFFLEAGRALHALQDSFTHTFRNPDDPGKIRVVLNWVEYTEDTLDEGVDGPPHASELDVCDDPDELRAERRQLATEASALVLMTLLDPALDRSEKQAAIDDALDRYVAFDEDAACALDNDWCNAPERKYGSPPLGCTFSASRTSWKAPLWLGLLALGLWKVRRYKWPGMVLALTVLCSAKVARADDHGPIDSPAAALSGKSEAAVIGSVDKAGAYFARAAVGASYDNAAFATSLGIHYQLGRKWMLGFDGEWNPYVATNPGRIRKGSANAYFSLIRRYQLRRENINVRTTLSAGASMLLFDLVGADKYSLGPFFGISFLGAEWKVRRGVYLTLDPTYIAIPVPSITGVPFMYAQYRFLLGVEVGG